MNMELLIVIAWFQVFSFDVWKCFKLDPPQTGPVHLSDMLFNTAAAMKTPGPQAINHLIIVIWSGVIQALSPHVLGGSSQIPHWGVTYALQGAPDLTIQVMKNPHIYSSWRGIVFTNIYTPCMLYLPLPYIHR